MMKARFFITLVLLESTELQWDILAMRGRPLEAYAFSQEALEPYEVIWEPLEEFL